MQYSFSLVVLMLGLCHSAFGQDANQGKIKFQECVACHSIKPGENLLGPTLFGVYGRQAGTGESFRYSNAIKKSGVTWDADSLNKYLENPQLFIVGGRMPYSGMADEEGRKNLIAYLKSLR
jgi:cytochrome c